VNFYQRIDAFIADAKAAAADGLTLAELVELFFAFVELAVAEARALSMPGVEKKAYVLASVGYLFDAIAPFLPLGPLRLISWIILPIVRTTLLSIADRYIERVLRALATT
jgi:hypothetical protein